MVVSAKLIRRTARVELVRREVGGGCRNKLLQKKKTVRLRVSTLIRFLFAYHD